MGEPFNLREPCRYCSNATGHIEIRGGQNCAFCDQCGRFAYNAPKVETGETRRSVSTVHAGIRNSQRAIVIERARGLCELCATDVSPSWHISHMLSVDDGIEDGFTEAQLNLASNLLRLCEECNLGQGKKSYDPKLYRALCIRWIRRQSPAPDRGQLASE